MRGIDQVISKVVFLAGFMAVASLSLTMFVVSVGLLAGIPLNLLYVAIGLVLTLLSTVLAGARIGASPLNIACATLLFLAIAAVCIFAASLVNDLSFDGNSYHKQAVASLAAGWNPVYESSSDMRLFGRVAVVIDHYAQGLYYIQGCLYALTGIIESAKATTLIITFGAGAVLFSLLRSSNVNTMVAAGIALALCLNPVVLAQCTTFYVDCFLMMSLFMLIVSLVMVVYARNRDLWLLGLVMMALSILLCVGTKFTGLAYAGVFSLSFGILYLIRVWRKESPSPRKAMLMAFGGGALSFVIAIAVVGAGSYCKNTIDYGNPFWPLAGEGSIDIMTENSPHQFLELSNPEKIFLSTFSSCSNSANDADAVIEPKSPVYVDLDELSFLTTCDLRIGGYGPLWGLIFIASTILFLILLIWSFGYDRPLLEIALAYMVPTVCLNLLLAESWWARYSCYSYFVVPLLLFFLYRFYAARISSSAGGGSTANPKASSRALAVGRALFGLVGFVFVAAVTVNTYFWVNFGLVRSIEQSEEFTQALNVVEQKLEPKDKELVVSFRSCGGHLYTLEERGIEYVIEPYDENNEVEGNLCAISYRLDPL